MKFLVVDDEWSMLKNKWVPILEKFGEVIEVVDAATVAQASDLIKSHPEADIILLDGFFRDGGCELIAGAFTETNSIKIFCFSSDGDAWWYKLAPKGVKHFPGKDESRMEECLTSNCECELGPRDLVVMQREYGLIPSKEGDKKV